MGALSLCGIEQGSTNIKCYTSPPYLSPKYFNEPAKFEKQILAEINRRVDEQIQNLIIDKFFIQMNQE